ncbi:MAG: glycosyltransferase family 2 protein [Paludibacteraceae bacterium]
MATLNGEKYIKEQIDSILIQLGSEDELIISDDGSTDKTLEIIGKFDDERIKLYQNNIMNGYAHNFENALIHSSGDYIFFSDQDDVWLQNKVETMLPYLKEDNFVISDAFITDDNLEIRDKLSSWRKYKKGYFQNLYKSIYAGCTCAFTKRIKNYALPFPATKYIQHDNWIGLLSELKFNVVYIDEALIYYRRHENNTSGAGSRSEKSLLFMSKYRIVLMLETLKRWTVNSICKKT